MQNETQKEIAGIQSATSRQNTKDQEYAQNEMLAYQQKESTARVDKQASHFVHIPGLSYSGVKSPDRKSGSAGMPRPISYAVFCLKKKIFVACVNYLMTAVDLNITLMNSNHRYISNSCWCL